MGKRVLKNYQWRLGGRVHGGVPNDVVCRVLGTFLPNPLKLIQVGEKMSVVAMLATYYTRLTGLESLIFGWLCVIISHAWGRIQ